MPDVPSGRPRGRPKLPDHLKKAPKVYEPTGKARGRPAKGTTGRKGRFVKKAKDVVETEV